MKSKKAAFKFALLFGSALFASGAFAQQEAPKSSSGLEEIIVTAQRREENIQETPISITVFTAENLEKLGILDPRDLTRFTPGFMYREDTSTVGYPLYTIRGFTQTNINPQFQPAIATYIDGIYATSTVGSVFTGGFFDVERVEILKGPQGTLFGRNTIAGVINLTTKLPTGKFEGKILPAAGSHGSRELSGVLNIPLAGDDVGFRLVAQGTGLDGYGKNLTTNTTLNGKTQGAARATFRARKDRLEVVARGEYSNIVGSGVGPRQTVLVPASLLPASLPVRQAALELGLANSPAGFTPAVLAAAYQGILDLLPPNPRDVRSPLGFSSYGKTRNASADFTATYELTDALQLKSITGYRKGTVQSRYDDFSVPIIIIQNTNSQTTKQFSQEIQLNGSAVDERIKFAMGGFYYHSNTFRALDSLVAPRVNPGSPVMNRETVIDSNYAGYGQVTYTILPDLNATAGIRYTDEKVTNYSRSRRGTPLACQVAVEKREPSEPCLGIFPTSFSNTSWTAGLDYKISTDLMVYGKASTGFKAGGSSVGNTNSLTYGPFFPETVRTYEVGLKSELFDRRLRANLAIYNADYTNIQRNSNFFNPVTGQSGGRVANAASGRVRGAELDLTAVPTDNLELNGGVAFVDAKYSKYVIPSRVLGAPPIDRTQEPFQDAAKWQLSGSIAYTVPVSFGSVRFECDATYQSKVVLDPANLNAFSQGSGEQPGYALANARVTLGVDDKGLEATAYVTNISDKLYKVGAIDLADSFGASFANYGPPRMWGVRLTKRF